MTADDYWRKGYEENTRVRKILNDLSSTHPAVEEALKAIVKETFLDGIHEGISRQANATLRKVE